MSHFIKFVDIHPPFNYTLILRKKHTSQTFHFSYQLIQIHSTLRIKVNVRKNKMAPNIILSPITWWFGSSLEGWDRNIVSLIQSRCTENSEGAQYWVAPKKSSLNSVQKRFFHVCLRLENVIVQKVLFHTIFSESDRFYWGRMSFYDETEMKF